MRVTAAAFPVQENPQEAPLPGGFTPEEWLEVPEPLAFLETVVLGNSVLQWGIALVVLLVAHPALRLALRFVANRLEAVARHTRTDLDDLAAQLLRKTRGPVVFLLAVWLASTTLGGLWSVRAATLARIAILIQVGLWAGDVLTWLLERYRKRQIAEDDPGAATAIGAMGFLGKLGLWSVIALTGVATLGFEIGPALAGLGVGGIAVALAVQNILGDLFASLSIIFDRPFVLGDFIIVGDQMGTVEHVGLKTTRVRSLSGEQLIFSNSDLLNSRVRNFKRMNERRVVFRFGVQYDTGHERLREIPGIVREIVESRERVRFDRAHFATFGDSSLEFEVVYFMLVPDFTAYMDAQQAINLEIYRRLEELGVGFAFPTRTVHLHLDRADAELRTRAVGPANGGEPHGRREAGREEASAGGTRGATPGGG